MKEHPILFNGPMVRALLDGQKTQTRRIVNPKHGGEIIAPGGPGIAIELMGDDGKVLHIKTNLFPYGQPGDRLWVRESWRAPTSCDHLPPRSISDSEAVRFIADETVGADAGFGKGRPGMFMPRWASRITLEIVSVRVERLQDISESDALAEGITCENVIVSTYYANGHHEVREDRYFFGGCQDEGFDSAVEAYAALWESINGAGSWEANSWLWVVEFRRLP